MAWASFDFRSETLNMPVKAEVLIPQPGYKSLRQKKDYKVIILLHGAMVCGLNHTGTFGNIAAFSGALGAAEESLGLPVIRTENIFGKDMKRAAESRFNPFRICGQIDEKDRPRIFMCCGSEDRLLDVNRIFYDCISGSYDVTVVWGEGAHEFQYWNERLKEMFVWFCRDDIEKGFFMGRNGSDFC